LDLTQYDISEGSADSISEQIPPFCSPPGVSQELRDLHQSTETDGRQPCNPAGFAWVKRQAEEELGNQESQQGICAAVQ
jgi:hypothetical protein